MTGMKQIALDIGLASVPSFSNFFPGPNEAALKHLELWTSNSLRSPVPTYIWGEPGSGKTHLLNAVIQALHVQGARVGWMDASSLEPPEFNESWAAVVLDEAFDKADNEFTAMAMHIFENFGFQMIVATPLKSVMTLEPFIGGACFVDINGRHDSGVLMIEYDAASQSLAGISFHGLPDDCAQFIPICAANRIGAPRDFCIS